MDIHRHFFEYTLTTPQLHAAIGIFSFIFTAAGIFAVVIYKKEKRKMAWIISLLNAFVLTIIASAYCTLHIPLFIKDGRSAFHAVNDVSVLISMWLCLANIFDLGFGLIFYRTHLDPLTAYVHHTLYIWITIVAAFGTGGFQNFEPFAGGLSVLMIEELPTFLLAMGSVFPSMRTDLGFGITFGVFRVMYHGAMMAYAFYCEASTLVMVLLAITMTMHLFWFVTWLKKYLFKAVKKAK